MEKRRKSFSQARKKELEFEIAVPLAEASTPRLPGFPGTFARNKTFRLLQLDKLRPRRLTSNESLESTVSSGKFKIRSHAHGPTFQVFCRKRAPEDDPRQTLVQPSPTTGPIINIARS